MLRIATLTFALASILGLGACSMFGPDEAETPAASEAGPAAEMTLEPVEAVRDIEIGRTRDGYVVTAFGTAPGLGYATPELRPRRDGQPGPDGMLDFDFVAQPPDRTLNLGEGPPMARGVRADYLVSIQKIEGVRGVRIHALTGGLQLTF